MIICDKCKRKFSDEREIVSLKLGIKEFDLCDICIERLIRYVEIPEKQTVLGSLGNMFKV